MSPQENRRPLAIEIPPFRRLSFLQPITDFPIDKLRRPPSSARRRRQPPVRTAPNDCFLTDFWSAPYVLLRLPRFRKDYIEAYEANQMRGRYPLLRNISSSGQD